MSILRECWPRWFGGKASVFAYLNPDIYWVPWSYFMEDEFIDNQKNDLVANLFNKKAKESLYEELYKAGKLKDKITDFNFSTDEPLLWSRVTYQSRSVNFKEQWYAPVNPKYWALGNFSINALAKGTVIPLDGGGYRICVTGIYLFIHDTFNFEDSGFLGFWDMKKKLFPYLSLSLRSFENDDFRDFREKFGYGKNFTLLSSLYRLPDFTGYSWDVK